LQFIFFPESKIIIINVYNNLEVDICQNLISIELFQGIDNLPKEVTDLLSLATNAPPIARAVIAYGLFAVGVILLVIAVTCLIRSSGRQETLNLEGTSHYVKPEKKPSATSGHSDATNGHTNGKGKTLETLNPAFVGGPENGVTNQ
jgi:hypothetical protein